MDAGKNTKKLLDKQQVADISAALINAEPPPKRMTKGQALSALSADIRTALEGGHTTTSIVSLLVLQGLQVSERQVSQALREAGKKKTVAQRKATPA